MSGSQVFYKHLPTHLHLTDRNSKRNSCSYKRPPRGCPTCTPQAPRCGHRVGIHHTSLCEGAQPHRRVRPYLPSRFAGHSQTESLLTARHHATPSAAVLNGWCPPRTDHLRTYPTSEFPGHTETSLHLTPWVGPATQGLRSSPGGCQYPWRSQRVWPC